MGEVLDIIEAQKVTKARIVRSAEVFAEATDYARANAMPLYAAGHKCFLIGDGADRMAYYPTRQTCERYGQVIRENVEDIAQAVVYAVWLREQKPEARQ